MKHLTQSLLLLLTISLLMIGCRPEEEATDYGMFKQNLSALNSDVPLMDNACSKAPNPDLSNADNIEECQMQDGCQAVFDGGGSTYIGCVPTPVIEEPKAEEPAAEEPKAEEPAPAPSAPAEEEQASEPAPVPSAPAEEEQASEPAPAPSAPAEEEMPSSEPAPTPSAPAEEEMPNPVPPVEGDTGIQTTPPPVPPTNNEDPYDGYYCYQVDGNVEMGKQKDFVTMDEENRTILFCHLQGQAAKSKCLPTKAYLNAHSKNEAHLGACTEEELQKKNGK